MSSPRRIAVAAAAAANASPSKHGSTLDEDLALARVLQEQENAFMMLAGSSGGYSSGPQSELDANEQDGLESGDLDDEELARRLQAEEDQALYQRMCEMTGFGGEGPEGYEPDDATDPDNLTYENLSALGDIAGTVPKGLAPDAVRALPEATHRQLKVAKQKEQATFDEDMCAICRMEYEDDEVCKVLPCKHVFHSQCVGQWLDMNKVCPCCNKEIGSDDQQRR